MNETLVANKNAQTVKVMEGRNPRTLYQHQIDAIAELNKMDRRESFSSLVVLPTGGGKTFTAVYWLLKAAIDKKKKVLWIAHRHLLLEQAAEAFEKNAFSDVMLNETSFKYRIISGQHDKPIHIKQDDNVLIVSKDSIIRNLDLLGKWLKEEDVYLIIDEAHHAAAKSYRRIIDYVDNTAVTVKLLGLTATPFRTSEKEKGLLGKIFKDDIAYKIDLTTLIKKGILSTPECESYDTQKLMGESLGLKALKSIENLDKIPQDIAEEIANDKERNRFIVEKYFQNENYKKYKQTLVFALNRLQAFALKALFEKYAKKYGIKNFEAGVIVSGTTAEFIGIDISDKENARQIEKYRNGEVQVLINVNILTEGTDLPKTQTVFLTRPTISEVLMTQMIGRALRGEKAGGTAKANIVSFIDDWNNKIAWVNPETILEGEGESGPIKRDYKKRILRLISIAEIEKVTSIIDETVDTRALENIDFIKRIPLGMYVFSFIDENNIERNHQILVYDSTKEAYENLIKDLPDLFKEFEIEEEKIEQDKLNALCDICESTYFFEDMIPPYNKKDVEHLFKFFAQKESEPLFVPMDEIDRKKVDLSVIARKIVDEDMGIRKQKELVESLWNDESGVIRIYYGNKYFMIKQLENEVNKIMYSEDFISGNKDKNVIPEKVSIARLSLYEIRKIYPEYARKLSDEIYNKAMDEEGYFHCNNCGKKSKAKGLFQIDHIKPMAKGGLTEDNNLQLLCRKCNLIKGDKE